MRPDVLTLAKGLGGGLPIGACIGLGECGTALDRGDHGSTFGGNPVACAAALAVLDTIETDGLLGHAAAIGAQLADGISAIAHPLLAGVRGRGLWLAVMLSRPAAGLAETHLPEPRVPGQRGAAGRDPARPAADPEQRAGGRVHRRAAVHTGRGRRGPGGPAPVAARPVTAHRGQEA